MKNIKSPKPLTRIIEFKLNSTEQIVLLVLIILLTIILGLTIVKYTDGNHNNSKYLKMEYYDYNGDIKSIEFNYNQYKESELFYTITLDDTIHIINKNNIIEINKED